MAMWKNDNLLARYREATPIGERDALNDWRTEKDYDDSLTGSRANLDRRLTTFKKGKGSDFEDAIDPENYIFYQIANAFDDNTDPNDLKENWVDILTHRYNSSDDLAQYLFDHSIVLENWEFPYHYEELGNYGDYLAFPDDVENGWTLTLLDTGIKQSQADKDFCNALLKKDTKSRIEFVKRNGIPLDIVVVKNCCNAYLNDISELPKNIVSDQDFMMIKLTDCIGMKNWDDFERSKHFDTTEKSNKEKVLKLLSEFKFRKLADCIRKGYLELGEIYFEKNFDEPLDDSGIPNAYARFNFHTSTKILGKRDGEKDVPFIITEALMEFLRNTKAVMLEDLGENR